MNAAGFLTRIAGRLNDPAAARRLGPERRLDPRDEPPRSRGHRRLRAPLRCRHAVAARHAVDHRVVALHLLRVAAVRDRGVVDRGEAAAPAASARSPSQGWRRQWRTPSSTRPAGACGSCRLRRRSCCRSSRRRDHSMRRNQRSVGSLTGLPCRRPQSERGSWLCSHRASHRAHVTPLRPVRVPVERQAPLVQAESVLEMRRGSAAPARQRFRSTRFARLSRQLTRIRQDAPRVPAG